ncbi:MAG: hypothetical protein NC113_07100 [Bacteroides sp.]|nr:hypothetical protein [Bacteroides sp.]MCM1447972.1 hypothetical protein [Bacteroides sp.]MCM1516532.1 hypothetical protein [Paraprevotella sp.]
MSLKSPLLKEYSTTHGRRVRPDFCAWSALGPISLFIENIMGIPQRECPRQHGHMVAEGQEWYARPAQLPLRILLFIPEIPLSDLMFVKTQLFAQNCDWLACV